MCADDIQTAGRRPTGRRLALVALAGAVVGACAEPPADSPPAEAASPPPGVHGVAPAAVAGTPSVITLLPSGVADTPPPRESPRLDQLGLAFTPTFLMVRAGETVSVTNSETIAHNVHVAFSDNDSTVLHADTDPAAHVDLVLDREGGYEVSCELHPGMRAFIYVTSAPFATFADNGGSFRIADVPAGSYTLAIWSVDSALRSERQVEVTGPSTEVR